MAKHISIIGVPYKNMGEGLLTGAEMTQKTTASPKQTPPWVTVLKT